MPNFQIPISKDFLKRYLLIIFLVLVPTQLGRHWWLEWSYVNGLRVDYLSPTLYVIDLIWVTLALVESRKFIKLKERKWIWFLGLAVVNILVAENRWAAGYKWLRIGQWLWTVGYLAKEKELVKKYLVWVIPGWILLETGLGMAQLIKAGSVGGWFYWLGERRFSLISLGIAKFAVGGRDLVRAYGTFSHPNSLAGFLLVAWMVWNRIRVGGTMKAKIGSVEREESQVRAGGTPPVQIFYWVVMWTTVVGIVISGSRVIWGLGLVVLILGIKEKRKWVILGLMVLAGFVVRWIGINYRLDDFVGGWDGESLIKRMELNRLAVKVWQSSPWLGVGLNNFWQKANVWQPVHNIPLLWLAELGIGGLLIFNFQFSIFNKLPVKKYPIIALVVGVTAMVDHYWWTLPQNSWLLAIAWAILR